MKNKFKYVVYKATLGGEVLYIGSGVKGREKHCASGVSHVYKLNELHFNGASIETVVVKDSLSKEGSMSLEKDLITKLKPLYNVVHNDTTRMGRMLMLAQLSKVVSKELNNYQRDNDKTGTMHYRYLKAVEELVTLIGIKNLLDGVMIPSSTEARVVTEDLRVRALLRKLHLKGHEDRMRVWFETVFEYNKTGSRITLKVKDSVVKMVDVNIRIGAGMSV